jgi:hypothetical protein
VGDLRRERADEVEPGERGGAAVRPVRPSAAGGPDAVLALQATAGNAAVTRLLQDQEQSWANPSRAVAGEPALVGTIYFKTKERSTDTQDEEVLGLLAKAYAPWAMRNAVNSGGERGLHGQVVGYADPRPSVEPDNSTLSGERADIVARRLTRHLIESTHGLIEGDFDIGRVAGGVAAADAELMGGPENLTPLGRLRRAEIYLAGQAMEPESGEKLPEAPVIEPVKVDDGWERWVPALERGDADTATGVAAHIYGYLTGMGGNIRDVFENTGRIPLQVKIGHKKKTVAEITYGNHGGTLPFKPVKPPWWDSRTSGHPSAGLGRRALDPGAVKHQRLIDKSLMLVSDMRRMNELMDVTVGDPSKAYLMFMTELRKDAPDVAKLKEYAVPVQQLMFVMDAVKAESVEVLQLAGDR